jgi:hypothetical protein
LPTLLQKSWWLCSRIFPHDLIIMAKPCSWGSWKFWKLCELSFSQHYFLGPHAFFASMVQYRKYEVQNLLLILIFFFIWTQVGIIKSLVERSDPKYVCWCKGWNKVYSWTQPFVVREFSRKPNKCHDFLFMEKVIYTQVSSSSIIPIV